MMKRFARVVTLAVSIVLSTASMALAMGHVTDPPAHMPAVVSQMPADVMALVASLVH